MVIVPENSLSPARSTSPTVITEMNARTGSLVTSPTSLNTSSVEHRLIVNYNGSDQPNQIIVHSPNMTSTDTVPTGQAPSPNTTSNAAETLSPVPRAVSMCYTLCNPAPELQSLFPLVPLLFPRPLLRIHYFSIPYSNFNPSICTRNSICPTLLDLPSSMPIPHIP